VLRTARTVGFVVFCAGAAAAIGVPAVRAQRDIQAANHPRDARTVAQSKIAPRVLSEIYRRRGEARHSSLPVERGRVPLDRHGRVLVDVRADVQPEKDQGARRRYCVLLHPIAIDRRLDALDDARAPRGGSCRTRDSSGVRLSASVRPVHSGLATRETVRASYQPQTSQCLLSW
jgi:hypothetical protein